MLATTGLWVQAYSSNGNYSVAMPSNIKEDTATYNFEQCIKKIGNCLSDVVEIIMYQMIDHLRNPDYRDAPNRSLPIRIARQLHDVTFKCPNININKATHICLSGKVPTDRFTLARLNDDITKYYMTITWTTARSIDTKPVELNSDSQYIPNIAHMFHIIYFSNMQGASTTVRYRQIVSASPVLLNIVISTKNYGGNPGQLSKGLDRCLFTTPRFNPRHVHIIAGVKYGCPGKPPSPILCSCEPVDSIEHLEDYLKTHEGK